MDIVARISTDELQKVLQNIGRYNKQTQAAIKKEIIASAYRVDAAAKGRAPVKTGRLRSSIHVKTKNVNDTYNYTDNNGNRFNGTLSVEVGEYSAAVGTNVDYAPKMEQRDLYLKRSADEETPKFIQKIKEAMKP